MFLGQRGRRFQRVAFHGELLWLFPRWHFGEFLLGHFHVDLLGLGVRVLGGGGGGGGEGGVSNSKLLVNFVFDPSFTLLHFTECITKYELRDPLIN
jgi:hypothetical protein